MIFRGLKIEGDFLFYVLHVDGNGVVVVEPLCYLLGAVHRSVLAAGTPTPAVRGGCVVAWGRRTRSESRGCAVAWRANTDERNALTGREMFLLLEMN